MVRAPQIERMAAMTDQIAVTGNLTSPPERRSISGGGTMVTFGLASTERRLENGVWTDGHTNFYSVSVFRLLGEHALSSLEKGQRVIVQGKLKLKKWEVNGRSGTSVDLEATSIGPDLMFGVATFVKDLRPGATPADAQTPPDAEWAADETVDARTGEVQQAPSAGEAGRPEPGPALIGAGGWAAPPLGDGTPF